jgi:hypothetical protein
LAALNLLNCLLSYLARNSASLATQVWYREAEAVRLALQLEAQLRCEAAVSVLQAAAADGFDKQAKSAAGEFILR